MSNTELLQQTRYPTDYNLVSIDLVTTGKTVSLKPLLVELNYFEDLYSTSISGDILVADTLGLIPLLLINGSEFIELEFKKSYEDNLPIKRRFRVFKISKRSPELNNMYENYIIKFCSEELLLSEQYRISKSYKTKKISEIITDILKNYLKVDKKIFIEDTTGTYDFVLPNKKIFETINWLSMYALPNSKNPGADMIFFENSDGFWFKSLQTLFKQKSFQTYYFNPKNITTDMNQKMTNIISFEVIDSFDMLDGISNGTFVNKVISVDPLTRQFKTTSFNYNEYFNKAQKLNKSKVTSNYKNRLGYTNYDTPTNELQTGSFRLVTTNNNQKKQKYISQKGNAVAEDINIEIFMSNRTAQMSLANYVRVKVSVPGNPQLTVGMPIDLNIFAMKPVAYSDANTNQKKLDPFYSGKYIISAVRHIIQDTSYITVMELAKDSYLEDLPNVNNLSSDWKQLIGGNK